MCLSVKWDSLSCSYTSISFLDKELSCPFQLYSRFYVPKITIEACLTVRIIENGGVMVNVLASSAVGRRFQSRSSQTNGYKIGICCFSTKHTALKIKDNDR